MTAGCRILALGVAIALSAPLALQPGGPARAEDPSASSAPRQRPAELVSDAPTAGALPSSSIDEAVARALGLGVPAPQGSASPALPADAGLASSPRPRARRLVLARAEPVRRQAVALSASPGRAARSEDGPIERGLCGLQALEGRRLPAITESNPVCGIAEPVRITAVHGVPLSQAARMDCDMARAVAGWVGDSVLPEVGARGGGVAQITVIGEYACRTRNSQAGARISEHARGRAIDIAGFTLADGTRVRVQDEWRRRPYGRALLQMFEEACGRFRTALGPDADRFHQDHFHLDLAQRRGNGTYCE